MKKFNRAGFIEEFNQFKPPIDKELLANQLSILLKDISLEEFTSFFTNPFKETINYFELSSGKKTCMTTSLLFNPHRLEVHSGDKRSPVFDALGDSKFPKHLARAILYRRYIEKVDVEMLLYYALTWGTGGTFFAAEFPPYLARDLCLKYKCNVKSKILDPCAGWGGRMLGVSVVSNYYECFEPATKTANGLNKLFKFISGMNPEFRAKIRNMPFEDAKLPSNYYDFALTSPPYYDTEIYCEEESNSCNKYKNFESWVDGFYLPFIEKTMRALKPSGTFILNIGDRKYPLSATLKDNFSKKYSITRENNYIRGKNRMGSKGEGEIFYVIKK